MSIALCVVVFLADASQFVRSSTDVAKEAEWSVSTSGVAALFDESAQFLPQVLDVNCPEQPLVDGHYTMLVADVGHVDTHNHRPVWVCGEKRLYLDEAGHWDIAMQEANMTWSTTNYYGSGIVRSVTKNGTDDTYVFPDRVAEWEWYDDTSTGWVSKVGWVKSSMTVAVVGAEARVAELKSQVEDAAKKYTEDISERNATIAGQGKVVELELKVKEAANQYAKALEDVKSANEAQVAELGLKAKEAANQHAKALEGVKSANEAQAQTAAELHKIELKDLTNANEVQVAELGLKAKEAANQHAKALEGVKSANEAQVLELESQAAKAAQMHKEELAKAAQTHKEGTKTEYEAQATAAAKKHKDELAQNSTDSFLKGAFTTIAFAMVAFALVAACAVTFKRPAGVDVTVPADTKDVIVTLNASGTHVEKVTGMPESGPLTKITEGARVYKIQLKDGSELPATTLTWTLQEGDVITLASEDFKAKLGDREARCVDFEPKMS